MPRQSTFLTLVITLLLATRCVPGARAAGAPVVTTVTSRVGTDPVYVDQVVRRGQDCPATTDRSPEGGDSHACRPPDKLPRPLPPHRPIPIPVPYPSS